MNVELPEKRGAGLETPPEGNDDRIVDSGPAFEFQQPAPDVIEPAMEHVPSRAERISATTSIEQLCDVLQDEDEQAGDAIEKIRAAQEYLSQHINEIIIGVVNGGNEGVRQEFGKIVDVIGDLLIIAHVKVLMKEQMKSYFEADKKAKGKELARQALAQSQSFDELYKTINLYQNLEGVGYQNEITPSYKPIEVINQIDALRIEFARRFGQGVAQRDLETIGANIGDMVGANQIIADVGLTTKVAQLLMLEVKQQRLEVKAAELAQPNIVSRWGSKFMGLFGRKK